MRGGWYFTLSRLNSQLNGSMRWYIAEYVLLLKFLLLQVFRYFVPIY